MSRATAAPSATASAPVVARAGGPAAAAPAPAIPRSRSAVSGALEGTPGRMRVLAFVAAVVAAAFGLVGAMSLWSSAGAPRAGRPQHRAGSADPGHLRRPGPSRRGRDELVPRRRYRGPRPAGRLRREPGPGRHGHRRRGGRAAGRQRGPGSAQRRGPGLRRDDRGGAGLQPPGPAGRRSVPRAAPAPRCAATSCPSSRPSRTPTRPGPMRSSTPAADYSRWSWSGSAPWRCSCSSWSGWPGAPTATSTRRCSSVPWWCWPRSPSASSRWRGSAARYRRSGTPRSPTRSSSPMLGRRRTTRSRTRA